MDRGKNGLREQGCSEVFIVIEAITSRGYQIELQPEGVTLYHIKTGIMGTFKSTFEAWLFTEGWKAGEYERIDEPRRIQ